MSVESINCDQIKRILESGEEIGENGKRNDVFHSEDTQPEKVVKVFYGEKIEDIRQKTDRASEDYFPKAEPYACDTTNIDNPDVLVKEENTVVVVENYSDGSILDQNLDYEDVVNRSVNLVDEMLKEGHIIDDFKAEEIHFFEDELKYVDFEDDKAIESWPLHCDKSTSGEVTYKMAKMYANLAANLSDEYDKSIKDTKDDIVEVSSVDGMIKPEVYHDKGFVPEMIDYWSGDR